jgi:2-phosphoglycerate kinase
LDQILRCILIGGTSNAGKTSVAKHIASRIGWTHVSTDSLARHPGRPWKARSESVPEHVVEHYSTLDTDELIKSVLTHYRNIWPLAEALIEKHAQGAAAGGLVLEGSALWPELVASLYQPSAAAIWLTATDDLLKARIYHESQYEQSDSPAKALIDKFVGRTHSFNAAMMEDLRRLGLPSVVVDLDSTIEAVADACLREMRPLTKAPPQIR